MSKKWIKSYCETIEDIISKDPNSKWRGLFILKIRSKNNLDPEIKIYIDLNQEKYDRVKIDNKEIESDPDFIISSSIQNFEKLINCEIDLMKGTSTGKFRIEGNLVHFLRNLKLILEIVNKLGYENADFLFQ